MARRFALSEESRQLVVTVLMRAFNAESYADLVHRLNAEREAQAAATSPQLPTTLHRAASPRVFTDIQFV